MKLGFIGAGKIAHTVADTLKKLNDKEIELYAVSARELKKAEEFKEKYSFKKSYGSYEDLLNDEEVDTVYINLVISLHAKYIKEALNKGKNVICEKAFTENAKQAKECIELAKKKKLYLMDATWTRFMPSRSLINELVATGIIGKVFMVNANLGYKIDEVPRLQDKNLGGGALLDVGVYPLNFIFMVLGTHYLKLKSMASFTDSDVDESLFANFIYPTNITASMMCTMDGQTNRNGYIYGDKGYIEVININNPEVINVYQNTFKDHKMELVSSTKIRHKVNGYEYEFLQALDDIKNNRIESSLYDFDEILKVMETIDLIKKNL